jgi:hypothetical protein
MLHQELAAAFKQVGERSPALLRIEQIVLLQAHPRQRAALARDLVAEPRQLLLVRQQLPTFGQPVLRGHDRVVSKVRAHCWVPPRW